MKTETKKEEKKTGELDVIKIGLTDDEYYTFYFRRPFAHESNEATNRFTETADLTGMEKGQKEFEIVKENLIKFSTRPIDSTNEKGISVLTIPSSFEKYFAEYTPANEAVILQAWFEFQKKQLLRLIT